MTDKPKAEFFMPPNHLKNKVGSGGVTDEILGKAQALLESHSYDFQPLADMYLDRIASLVSEIQVNRDTAKENNEYFMAALGNAAMQLKANGTLLHYPLVTQIAGRLLHFLETLVILDHDALEIILAFHSTMKAIVHAKIKGDGGKHGEELQQALIDACTRYLNKYSDKS